MHWKRSDHIQRDRFGMKVNNILQQPQNSCFKFISVVLNYELYSQWIEQTEKPQTKEKQAICSTKIMFYPSFINYPGNRIDIKFVGETTIQKCVP